MKLVMMTLTAILRTATNHVDDHGGLALMAMMLTMMLMMMRRMRMRIRMRMGSSRKEVSKVRVRV